MDAVSGAELADIRAVVAGLAEAWNAGDGVAFADAFADDAVFVDIKANRDDGRDAIRTRHVWLYETVFRGTTVRYDLLDAARVAPALVLGHVAAHLSVHGTVLHTLASCLFRRDGAGGDGAGWQILMFHNTLLGRYDDPT